MSDTTNTPAPEKVAGPGPRKLLGIVTRDKNDKTRRVEVARRVRHPKYGKFVKKRTVCYMHDEKNDSHLGDTVEIVESPPLSKSKRWALVRIVTRAPSRTLASLEGAVAGSQVPSSTEKK